VFIGLFGGFPLSFSGGHFPQEGAQHGEELKVLKEGGEKNLRNLGGGLDSPEFAYRYKKYI
jgi:hypothetical protein